MKKGLAIPNAPTLFMPLYKMTAMARPATRAKSTVLPILAAPALCGGVDGEEVGGGGGAVPVGAVFETVLLSEAVPTGAVFEIVLLREAVPAVVVGSIDVLLPEPVRDVDPVVRVLLRVAVPAVVVGSIDVRLLLPVPGSKVEVVVRVLLRLEVAAPPPDVPLTVTVLLKVAVAVVVRVLLTVAVVTIVAVLSLVVGTVMVCVVVETGRGLPAPTQKDCSLGRALQPMGKHGFC